MLLSAFRKYLQKKQLYQWTIFESYCSKQSNIFVKINVYPMHHSKVTSDTGPRVHGNSPTSSSQHFLSRFCCCLGEILKSTRLPLWLKPWCQHHPNTTLHRFSIAFQLKSDSGFLIILTANSRSEVSCSYHITF